MANPYGMVMGSDGRWEYDPFAYKREATNAQFRGKTPFPYMGVGSLGAGLMTQSPLAGLGSEIPGIRGPGGAPAWGAGLGASPLYSPSFSTEAVSGVSPSEYLGSIESGTTIGGLPSGPGIGGGAMVDPTWPTTGGLGPPEHTIDPGTAAMIMSAATPAGLIGGGAAAGMGLGALAGYLTRGAKVTRDFTGRAIPGTATTATEYAAAKAATKAGDAARLAAGKYGFPVASRGTGWKGRLAETLTKDWDVLSSTGKLTASIFDSDKKAVMSQVAKELFGVSTAATRAKALAQLKSELPDHDLSTAAKVSDYLSAMLKSTAVGKPSHIYSRNVPGPHAARSADEAVRAAMDKLGRSMYGSVPSKVGKGAAIGGTVGGIAGGIYGKEAEAVDDFSDFQTNPGRYAELTSAPAEASPTGFSIGQYGVDDQGVLVPTMTSALQQSINVGASDPNAPAGQVDIDASPTGWKAGQALVDRFGNPVTLSNDPQSVAAANYRSFLAEMGMNEMGQPLGEPSAPDPADLIGPDYADERAALAASQSPLADPGINVSTTIAEALTRGQNAIAEMGLTGATAAAAEQALTSSSGYITVDQIAGLQAAQQEQEQAEQALAEAQAFAAAEAQAFADAQAAAAQAVDDFSDYPSQGDYFDAAGNVVSGPAGAPQGAHHAGSAVSKAVDRAVQNAVIDALVNAVGPEESALSAGYMADLGYGGAFAAGKTGAEGLNGDNMGGFGSGWT